MESILLHTNTNGPVLKNIFSFTENKHDKSLNDAMFINNPDESDASMGDYTTCFWRIVTKRNSIEHYTISYY